MKKYIRISGNLNKRDKGLVFENLAQAITYLQNMGYSDYEISLVHFVLIDKKYN